MRQLELKLASVLFFGWLSTRVVTELLGTVKTEFKKSSVLAVEVRASAGREECGSDGEGGKPCPTGDSDSGCARPSRPVGECGSDLFRAPTRSLRRIQIIAGDQ